MKEYFPTIGQLNQSAKLYEEYEPRDLFYKVATELVELTLQERTSLTLVEALAVLLQTWNKEFYRYRNKFDQKHFRDIQELLNTNLDELKVYRSRKIQEYSDCENVTIEMIFNKFGLILGPVGASKMLHLLAPTFFPLWDGEISKFYGIYFKQKGSNGKYYSDFIGLVKRQIEFLGGEKAIGRNPLKAIDEFNYCKCTKGWID